MILNRNGLKLALEKSEIICHPISLESISIGSIDVRLDDRILLPTAKSKDSRYTFDVSPSGKFKVIPIDIEYVEHTCRDKPYLLLPGQFVLASTIEVIGQHSNQIESIIQGKSSLARVGLIVEEAGKIEATNYLNVTLEVFNMGSIPIELVYGMHIAQVSWQRVEGASDEPYQGKYQQSIGIGLPE
jgi:dCTP deaminase